MQGIDAGGVRKEFFQLVIRELFDLQYGICFETFFFPALFIVLNQGCS